LPSRVVFVALVALVACGHEVASTPTELRPGQASLAVRGTLQVAFHPRPIDLVLDGVACERLGWVNLYAAPPRHVIAFDPGVRALAVGDYAMGSSESEPRAWLNTPRAPVSVTTLRGTTRLTSVTLNEVAGVVDWSSRCRVTRSAACSQCVEPFALFARVTPAYRTREPLNVSLRQPAGGRFSNAR
jgi:hypothetical protein